MTLNEFFELGMKREIAEAFPVPKGGFHLNVGAGNSVIPGTEALDYPDWDADHDAIPYNNGSVSLIHAYHFLEHCADPVPVLIEFQRVLMPGGVVNIVVPYYTSQMAAHDLDHKHVFCEETWRVLFGNPYYNKRRINWSFEIGINVIMGIVERNLALLTQLRKV